MAAKTGDLNDRSIRGTFNFIGGVEAAVLGVRAVVQPHHPDWRHHAFHLPVCFHVHRRCFLAVVQGFVVTAVVAAVVAILLDFLIS